MALPSTGSLSIKGTAGLTSSIAYCVDGNTTGNKSLTTLSQSASKTAPHGMREFYGYGGTTLVVGWASTTPTTVTECSTCKFECMRIECSNLSSGYVFLPKICYRATLSAGSCYSVLSKRSGDAVWVNETGWITSASGSFCHFNVDNSIYLDIAVALCGTPTSCVCVCLPNPPATWSTGSGTITRGDNICWTTCFPQTDVCLCTGIPYTCTSTSLCCDIYFPICIYGRESADVLTVCFCYGTTLDKSGDAYFYVSENGGAWSLKASIIGDDCIGSFTHTGIDSNDTLCGRIAITAGIGDVSEACLFLGNPPAAFTSGSGAIYRCTPYGQTISVTG